MRPKNLFSRRLVTNELIDLTNPEFKIVEFTLENKPDRQFAFDLSHGTLTLYKAEGEELVMVPFIETTDGRTDLLGVYGFYVNNLSIGAGSPINFDMRARLINANNYLTKEAKDYYAEQIRKSQQNTLRTIGAVGAAATIATITAVWRLKRSSDR